MTIALKSRSLLGESFHLNSASVESDQILIQEISIAFSGSLS